MRNSQLIRQWGIVRTLGQGLKHDPHVLANAFGVSLKTVRRDIDALQDAGFPVFRVEDDWSGRVLVYMDKDWLTGCPGPVELPDGPATTYSRRDTNPPPQIKHQLAAARHTLIANGIEDITVPPPDTEHHLCSCGHHIEKQGLNGSTKVLGGKRGCSSCESWIRNLESGIL